MFLFYLSAIYGLWLGSVVLGVSDGSFFIFYFLLIKSMHYQSKKKI